MAKRERTTRDCPSCGTKYSCVWVIDQWRCRRCGDEWHAETMDPPEADVKMEAARDAAAFVRGVMRNYR